VPDGRQARKKRRAKKPTWNKFCWQRGTNFDGREELLKAVEVVHTRVFAASQNGGNPCPVIPFADKLTDRQMQRLAREFGFDTAFIVYPLTKGADIRLRYFVPDHEMGVSRHATIAAITIALLENRLKCDRIRVETMTGIFEVESIRSEDGIIVTLAQNKPVFGPTVAPDLVARALTIDPKRIVLAGSPIQSVSVSRAKLVIPLEDSKVLDSFTPDYEALWKLCDQFRVTGFYPFTRQTDKTNAQVEARQFPQRAGFPEDAATGVAAAALGAYLATYDYKCQTGPYEFRVAQGYAMQAPSLIEAFIECAEGKVTRTAIRGRAQVLGREWVDA
jgi:PhzF family phenazine biosynthesis protein